MLGFVAFLKESKKKTKDATMAQKSTAVIEKPKLENKQTAYLPIPNNG